MVAIACVILTAAGCYFSFGLGPAWWLAWFAPVPVLWLVFGETRPSRAFLAAMGARRVMRALGPVPAMFAFATLYDRIGDAFGWLCLVLGMALVGATLPFAALPPKPWR
jgi:hypothetical protein